MNLHAVDAVVELYRLMDDADKAKVKKHLKEDLMAEMKKETDNRSPCEINGHKFKRGPKKTRFILPPQEVVFCERCGLKKLY